MTNGDNILVICECDRRYLRRRMLNAAFDDGVKLCACGRTLGAWTGHYRVYFEPETEDMPPA